jgi:hypothetical protein
MALSLKITVKFTDVNRAGVNDNTGYKVYRANGEDPCPDGIPKTSAPGFNVYTSTSPPAFADNDGVGTIEHEDTTVTFGVQYYYRSSLTRGSDEVMTQSVVGPVFVQSSWDLAYPGNVPDNQSGLPNSISVAPICHYDASFQSFFDSKGTVYDSTLANQIINKSSGYLNLRPHPHSSYALQLDDCYFDATIKTIRPGDAMTTTNIVHTALNAHYFDDWGPSHNYIGHEKTGDFYSNPEIAQYINDFGDTLYTRNTRGLTNGISGRCYIFDKGASYFMVYIPKIQSPNIPEVDGSSNFKSNVSKWSIWGGVSTYPSNYFFTRWSDKSNFVAEPGRDDNLLQAAQKTGFWRQRVKLDLSDKLNPAFAGGSWSTKKPMFGVQGSNMSSGVNLLYTSGDGGQTVTFEETPDKVNVICGYIDYDTGTSKQWLNGNRLPDSTSDGTLFSNINWDNLDTFLKNKYNANLGPFADPSTGDLPNNSVSWTGRDVPMSVNNGTNFQLGLNFTEFLFFAEKLSSLDQAKVINYFQGKFGSSLAPQGNYF